MDVDESKKTEKREIRHLMVLQAMNKASTTRFVALVAKTRMAPSTLSDRMKEMISDGTVARCWKGTYQITDKGRDLLLSQHVPEPEPEEQKQEPEPTAPVAKSHEGEIIVNQTIPPKTVAVLRRFVGGDGRDWYEIALNNDGYVKLIVIPAVNDKKVGLRPTIGKGDVDEQDGSSDM